MAKQAATISIALEAQTATLKKGFAEARGSIDRLDSRMRGHIQAGMMMYTAALAAITSALMLLRRGFSMIIGQMQELDAQQKMADKINITADAMGALGHAATLSGESVEVARDAMRRFSKNLGEAAARGTGPAAKALLDLGLNAQKLSQMKTERAVGAIADAMMAVGNQHDRMRLAMELFGRQGHVFVNMLANGSAGLQEFQERYRKLGGEIGDNRRVVEEANDALADMNVAWDSLKTVLIVGISPAIKQISSYFAELIADIRSLRVELDGLGAWGSKILDFAMGGQLGLKAWDNIREAISQSAERTEHLRKSTVDWTGGLEEAAGAVDDLRSSMEEYEKQQEDLRRRAESVYRALRTPLEVFQDTMTELDDLVMEGALTWDLYSRGVRRAVTEMLKGKQASDWSTPGVGAVTRSSMAGFSAVQQAKREKEDADRRHRESVDWYRRIEEAVRRHSLILTPEIL